MEENQEELFDLAQFGFVEIKGEQATPRVNEGLMAIPADVVVSYAVDGIATVSYLQRLGIGGCVITIASQKLLPGTKLRLSLVFPGELTEYLLDAEILGTFGFDCLRGTEISFLSPDGTVQEKITRYLEAHVQKQLCADSDGERAAPRICAPLQATLLCNDNSYPFSVDNISLTGAYGASTASMPLGSSVVLSLRNPVTLAEQRYVAKVVRAEKTGGIVTGKTSYALAFAAVTQLDALSLLKYARYKTQLMQERAKFLSEAICAEATRAARSLNVPIAISDHGEDDADAPKRLGGTTAAIQAQTAAMGACYVPGLVRPSPRILTALCATALALFCWVNAFLAAENIKMAASGVQIALTNSAEHDDITPSAAP